MPNMRPTLNSLSVVTGEPVVARVEFGMVPLGAMRAGRAPRLKWATHAIRVDELEDAACCSISATVAVCLFASRGCGARSSHRELGKIVTHSSLTVLGSAEVLSVQTSTKCAVVARQ